MTANSILKMKQNLINNRIHRIFDRLIFSMRANLFKNNNLKIPKYVTEVIKKLTKVKDKTLKYAST